MVDGITVVGVYLVTKAVTTGIEEIFSLDNMASESTIRKKIRALYDRYLSREHQMEIRLLWKSLPLGIYAVLIDKDDVLFNVGRLIIVIGLVTNPTAVNTDLFLSESPVMKDAFKIIVFTALIATANAAGVCFCNYLRQRVPPPFDNILRRLQNGIDMR
jgi:hypothetical protein